MTLLLFILLLLLLLLQVRSDYMKELAESIDTDVAIKLGCIEMRYILWSLLTKLPRVLFTFVRL